MSIRSIEDRAERTDRRFWFRLDLRCDRAFDDRPIDRTRIAPDAHLIGRVRCGRDVSVRFGAVIRDDNDPITIGGDG